MRRDLRALSDETFDLLVIGAGIHGICAAWDAAQRGLKVALADRGDFCGGTSSNSLKIIHGGLRYLQRADLRRMRLSIRERSTLMRIAPHLVHPLGFLVPFGRRFTRRRFALRSALWLNDRIGFDRNRDLDEAHRLPPSRLAGPQEFERALPGASAADGGALWYDAQIHNSERLALAFLHRAAHEGVTAVNHFEITGLLVGSLLRVEGARGRDVPTGEEFDVRARAVLNAAGPWVDHVFPRPDRRSLPLAKAFNLGLRPIVSGRGVGVGGDSRLWFLVPWRDVTLAGTAHLPFDGDPSGFRVTEQDIEFLLGHVNRAHPGARLSREDVRFFHGGLQPRQGIAPDGEAIPLGRHGVRDDSRRAKGLVTLLSVKWTTARAVAEEAVDLVFRRLGRSPVRCRTAETPVHGGEQADADALCAEIREGTGLDETAAGHLAGTYGSAWTELKTLLSEEPGPVSTRTPVQRAEVLYGIREEMALGLDDLVFRRTELGTAGMPDEAALAECARLAARELAWDQDRVRREVQRVRARYVPDPG